MTVGQRAIDGSGGSQDALTSRPTVSIREFAAIVGVDPRAVRDAIALGRVPQNDDGTISPEIAVPLWTALRDDNNVRRPPKVAPVPRSPSSLDQATQSRILINKAKAEKEVYVAKMAKLNYEEKAGKLINAEEVRQAAFNQGRKIRERLRAMVTRVGPAIAGVSDPHQCMQMLEREISRALEEDGEEETGHVQPRASEPAAEVPQPAPDRDGGEHGASDPPEMA